MTLRSRAKTPTHRLEIIHAHGHCLAGLGILKCGSGHVIVDRDADIYVGDIVLCTRRLGTLNSYIKQVRSIFDDSVVVGTAYADGRLNEEFEAAEILGVVTDVYGEMGFLEYTRSVEKLLENNYCKCGEGERS